MMNRVMRSTIVLGLFLVLTGGCGKTNNPMPVTKQNLALYMQKVQTAASGISQNDFAEARTNPAKQKEVLYKSFIEPMEKMGYSFDRTIYGMINNIFKKEIPNADVQTAAMTSEMIMSTNASKEIFLKHGFISKETKELLDRMGQMHAKQ